MNALVTTLGADKTVVTKLTKLMKEYPPISRKTLLDSINAVGEILYQLGIEKKEITLKVLSLALDLWVSIFKDVKTEEDMSKISGKLMESMKKELEQCKTDGVNSMYT